MPALNINDLNNGKKDLDHIAEVATSQQMTAMDRLGRLKSTLFGAIYSLRAFNVRGAFVAGAAYAAKDVYTQGGIAYVALSDHVSTTVAADLAAGKVSIHQGAMREELAAAGGAGMLGFVQAGLRAIRRWVEDKLRESVSVDDYIPTGTDTATTNCTPYFQDAINDLIEKSGGGFIDIMEKTYRLDATGASGDGYANGVLLPDTGGDWSTKNGITIRGKGVSSVLLAGAPNMIVVRLSRLYSGLRNLRIDGGGLANVHGYAIVPEDMTQTTTAVSNSYQSIVDVDVENCVDGMIAQPGPTVNGVDSGCFYHNFTRVRFNNVSGKHVRLKGDVTGADNRVTRSTWHQCTFLRGADQVCIEQGTELDFIGCNFELFSGTAFKYLPDNAHAANIRLVGGYAESSGAAVAVDAPNAPWAVTLFDFRHNLPPSSSEYQMNRIIAGAWNVAKVPGLASRLSFGYPGFVDLVADPDNTGQRVAEIQTNGIRRERYDADGSKTFYGSSGNVKFDSDGRTFRFTGTGANSIVAKGVGASLYFSSDFYGWQTAAGVDVLSLRLQEFLPRVSNTTTLGGSGYLWSSIWAANGTIQTSDPRTKTDIVDSPLGLDFVRQLRPVAFRFKVGGNKIVGTRVIKPAVLDDEGREVERAVVEPIVEPVPGRRLHHGFLTTEVKRVLDQLGVDFGGYVKTDPDDPESPEALRYDQFIAPLVRAVQEVTARLEALESKG